ncbi:MAG: cbb3-type cytochrome oxidase assembly protein CcoS [Limnohabitans sp.]|jgi:cbb3-type cytochrome oxidase maturation protein|nr:cbb3-type cytochrome oxidase assembly protein CcoS [Limnohabitans sp.]
MELVFVALPVALLIGGAALAAFIWAARSDQFEDLDTPPQRAIFDTLPMKANGEATPKDAWHTVDQGKQEIQQDSLDPR